MEIGIGSGLNAFLTALYLNLSCLSPALDSTLSPTMMMSHYNYPHSEKEGEDVWSSQDPPWSHKLGADEPVSTQALLTPSEERCLSTVESGLCQDSVKS